MSAAQLISPLESLDIHLELVWERGDVEPPKVAELAAEYLLLVLERPKKGRRP